MGDSYDAIPALIGIVVVIVLVVAGIFASIFMDDPRARLPRPEERGALDGPGAGGREPSPEEALSAAVATARQIRDSPAPVPGRGEQDRRWKLARSAFREAQVRMARYETDPALAIDYPAFNDVSVPEVRAMVAALRRCSHLMDASDAERQVGEARSCCARSGTPWWSSPRPSTPPSAPPAA